MNEEAKRWLSVIFGMFMTESIMRGIAQPVIVLQPCRELFAMTIAVDVDAPNGGEKRAFHGHILPQSSSGAQRNVQCVASQSGKRAEHHVCARALRGSTRSSGRHAKVMRRCGPSAKSGVLPSCCGPRIANHIRSRMTDVPQRFCLDAGFVVLWDSIARPEIGKLHLVRF
jgi:hypothetical protein